MHKYTSRSEEDVQREKKIVRVTIPARAAYELDSFQKVIENLAERLGCRACLSGADCTFSLERDFLVNPESLKIESIPSDFSAGGF